jgi:protein phosphatase 1 regulatory subunit 11
MSAAQTSTVLKAAVSGQQDCEQKAPVAESITLRLVPRRKKKDERVHWSKDVQEINEFSGKFKSKS